jgi:hypothetical protein
MRKIPIVEVSPLSSGGTDIIMVPVEDIDDFLGEIGHEYDLGVGQLSTELGAVKVKAKASVNVKAKTPAKPTPPKPAPKPVSKAAPRPVSKPVAAKKPTTKPVTKKPAPKPAKPAVKVAAKVTTKVTKAPAKQVKVTAKVTAKKPVAKVTAKVVAKPKSVLGKISAAAKGAAKITKVVAKKPVSVSAVAKKAVSVIGKKATLAKPIALKTTVKPGPLLKLKPKASLKPLAIAQKVVSLAPDISALPAAAKTQLAIAATAPTTLETPAVFPKPVPLPPSDDSQSDESPVAATQLPESITRSEKPIASLMTRLNELQKPKTCACIIASKKPAQAALNDKPSLQAKYSQKIIDAAKLSPEEFQREVIGYLTQIEGDCKSDVLKNRLRRLSIATGVLAGSK